MSTSFPRRIRVPTLIALVCSLAAADAAYAAACAEPVPSVPAFAGGTKNTVTWTQITGALEGNGFALEVSTSPELKADGSFATVEQTALPPLGSRSRTISNLDERTHYYHLRARASATCSIGPWSAVVSTTQDATPPAVTVETPSRAYVMETFTLRGTAIDVPAASATAASGAREVLVALENQIAPLAAMHDQPRALVPVEPDGTWRASFAGVPLGVYSVSVTATDRVDNTSEPATTQVVVVAAP